MSSVNSYNWIELKIGEVAEVVAGGTPKAGNPDNFKTPGTGIAWLTPADLSGYTRKYISLGARDLSHQGYNSSSAKILPKGSLLFSSRAPIGYVAIAQNDISTNQGFKNFVFPCGVDSDYAYYYLRSIRDLAESLGTGTTFKEISGAVAKTLPFLLPPLAEQKAIADKLDLMLAQVATTKVRLERIPNILKTFRQSILTAAVSGKLTGNWRASSLKSAWTVRELPENNKTRRGLPDSVALPDALKESRFPESWSILSVASLLRKGVIIDLKDGNHGSNHPKSLEFTEKGLPFITAAQMSDNGKIDYDGAPKVSGKPLEKLKVGFSEAEDVIYSHKGTIGKVGIADRASVLNPQTTYIRLNQKYVLNQYYALMLKSNAFTSQVDAIKSQTTRDFVPITAHYSLFAIIPPIDEQVEIVRRVEELFACADNIEQKVNMATELVNNLPQSIFTKAFRGDLTADWRSANPELISGKNSAKALLEKIKAERGAIEKQPKLKRTTAKKKAGNRMNKQIIKVVEALKQTGKPLSGQQLLAAAGYPSDSSTDQLESFFLDIRNALAIEKSIVKLERSDNGQDWFALAETEEMNKA
ncbi:restriction endonuclease subunit S [Vibrio metschnikovii]|uniref:restriction endonuclease subunit S n=1 Tax=Vibrio metschnikovii TaxID=28172 RepID=UPI0001B94518|nr:restriction endonuclease subunit S [Vibrio metschnikovii]EEX37914.1 hsdS type I site-specific deoxyribonuclease [Vibrio metschnikovii CIP 69.14]SUP08104.1 type I restriction enzyme EcoKI S subunit [Vibrio metschnikovii]